MYESRKIEDICVPKSLRAVLVSERAGDIPLGFLHKLSDKRTVRSLSALVASPILVFASG